MTLVLTFNDLTGASNVSLHRISPWRPKASLAL
jgi:hypothetical protein